MSIPEALQSGALSIEGDKAKAAGLFAMLDQFQPFFNIVTPPVRP